VAFLGDDGKPFATSATGRLWIADEGLEPLDVRDGRGPTAPGEIAVDRRTADEHDLEIGQQVTVLTLAGQQPATIVGITSFGDQNCTQFGADTRVDAEIAFADQHIGPALKCVWDGECNADCMGGPDIDMDCPSCANDDDCQGDDVCGANGQCQPEPFSPGGLGSTCADDTECVTGPCLANGDDHKCSQDCADNSECPDDFECLPTDGASGACWPKSGGGGGCSTTEDASHPGAMIALFAMLGAVIVRRRRRR